MAKKPDKPEEDKKPLDAKCRIVLLHGDEGFLRSLFTTQLKVALEKEHGEESVEVMSFDGAATPAADILDECRSFGLIAAHKMIIVDQADQAVKEDSRPLFERYAQNPASGATLVLRASKWHPGKLDEMIRAVGAVKECEMVTEDAAKAWALHRAKKNHNAELRPDAAAMLIDRIGPELGRIDSELGKLAAAGAIGKGKEAKSVITTELVMQFVGTAREDDAWAVQGELLSGSAEANVRAVRQAIDVSRHAPTLVLFSIGELARKLHGASIGVRRGENPWALKGTLKLFGDTAEGILETAKRVNTSRARALLAECARADARSKSGLGDAELSSERLALRFAELLKPAR